MFDTSATSGNLANIGVNVNIPRSTYAALFITAVLIFLAWFALRKIFA